MEKIHRCKKCNRLMVEHISDVMSLPITSNPDEESTNKIKKIVMYYCKVCDKFETEFSDG